MACRFSKPLFQTVRTGLQRATSSAVLRHRATPVLAGLTIAVGAVYISYHDERVKYALQAPFLLHADSAHTDFRDDPKSKAAFRVDPDTSLSFPLDLSPTLATPSPPLSLVGLGVRKVSFLRVKVYSAGFYLDEQATQDLHHVEGWHNYTAQHLLTPPTTTPSDPLGAPQLSGEKLMENLFERPVAVAVRIVPNRNTDFGHLRDAFTRALTARQKLARSRGQLTEDDEQRITESIQTLKAFFPGQTVHKGKAVVLLRPREGGLIVEFEGKILGKLNDPWVGKQLMLTYFADKDVISDKLKEDVAKGLEDIVNRSN
ncbi:hypothetical protein I317_01196 [Kwoniella heveanensis CBS 569]|nr:hypothetical protein I317_01196 [Kwoniella heveanensis CBS 569]